MPREDTVLMGGVPLLVLGPGLDGMKSHREKKKSRHVIFVRGAVFFPNLFWGVFFERDGSRTNGYVHVYGPRTGRALRSLGRYTDVSICGYAVELRVVRTMYFAAPNNPSPSVGSVGAWRHVGVFSERSGDGFIAGAVWCMARKSDDV